MDISNEWFRTKKNVIELLTFLMDCELITTKEEVILFNEYPDRYTEVWKLYSKEMNGVY
jgi:hypothetical protein